MRVGEMEDDWMTPAELAQELDIPVRNLEQWRYLGKGPDYAKLGKHVRYRRSAVDAWVKANTITPSSRPHQRSREAP